MKPTVILIPGASPRASESIFRVIIRTLAEAEYEILVLERAIWSDLESKGREITSKILVGKSAGGRLVVEYQIRHKYAKALVLLAAAIKDKEQAREIKIPVLIIHGTADPIVPIENSRELAKYLENCTLVEIPGADHSYKGKEQEIAKIIVKWLNDVFS